jgi:hypothetical protein
MPFLKTHVAPRNCFIKWFDIFLNHIRRDYRSLVILGHGSSRSDYKDGSMNAYILVG